MKKLLSGNEAIALGAWEAGVRVASAYPGTPSTEILENIARYPEIYSEWAPNEKVALEVALGASFAGARALAAMKHVGLNVAADPLFTASYTGVGGGLVIVNADDPGMHSSQNEQDNRHYARASKVPMLEPSDSAEARDFTIAAIEISERFDTPVLLRTTTRVSHGKSIVEEGEPLTPPEPGFHPDPAKYVMIPAHGRRRHLLVEERTASLAAFAEESPLNRAEHRDDETGIITSGICYQYVREAAPGASVLKLGLNWPLPAGMIRRFASRVKRLFVVEELDPFLEDQIRAMGVELVGREAFPVIGELTPGLVRAGLTGRKFTAAAMPGLPQRAPAMCAGCPHRSVFYLLRKLKLTISGDIGCYTLAVGKPLQAMDTCVCMGASVSGAHGMEKAGLKGTVAVLGDSTFIHSGITGLIDIVYNGGQGTVVILDNRITAMTGRQENPASGRRLGGAETSSLSLEGICRAVGVEDVRVVDPYDMKETEQALRAAVEYPGPSVVITRRPCLLIDRKSRQAPLGVNADCRRCGICLKLGCPAIESAPAEDGKVSVRINHDLCNGCSVCAGICPFGAIEVKGDD